jgi:hypothetical protein
VDGFKSPSPSSVGVEAALQIEDHQAALQFRYFRPLKEKSAHSQQESLHHEHKHECSGRNLTVRYSARNAVYSPKQN